MQYTKRQGFSLVELIMTLAILAVVGIIGFTSFNGVSEKRENSKRVSDVEMFRNTVDTIVLQSGEVPEPTANRQYYKVSGAYSHSASGAVGVSSYLSPDVLGKFAHADHPRDPKTGSFYGFGKSYTKKGEYQIAAVITGSDGPRALVQGRYTGGQGTNFGDIPGLVKAYNSGEFLIDGDSEGLPYNPTEKVVTASIIESSGSVQISGEKAVSSVLVEGDILTVGTGSTATIKISDGTEAVIGSESNVTVVTLSELALKDDTGLLTRVKLSLGSGRILAKAPKLREMSEGERSDMQIESGGAVAAVRGTILGVDAGVGGAGTARTVTLLEGKIQMIGSQGGDNDGDGVMESDGNPIQIYTPGGAPGALGAGGTAPGEIEVFEGQAPKSVTYMAEKNSIGGGDEKEGVGSETYRAPDLINTPYPGDSVLLGKIAAITAAYTGTLAKLDRPSMGGKMIAPIHMSMTGGLVYYSGRIISPTPPGTVLTWENTVFSSNTPGVPIGTGSMELRYETKVVGTGDVKVVVIGNIVQGAELLAGTGRDSGAMTSENKEIASKHVNKILRRLDPMYSGTGNIFIGDLSSVTTPSGIVSGTTGNGYAYSGRTVTIPLKIDHEVGSYSSDEKVSFMLCRKGENGVWCTKPYNVTVDAWMVGGAPLAYSRVGTKKIGEDDEKKTLIVTDRKKCTDNGWSEDICVKTGDAGKDPSLVGITAFTGSCIGGTNVGDLNLYTKNGTVGIDTAFVATGSGHNTNTGGTCTSTGGNTFDRGGIVLDNDNTSGSNDFVKYSLGNLLNGNFRIEIETPCYRVFDTTEPGTLFTLVDDSGATIRAQFKTIGPTIGFHMGGDKLSSVTPFPPLCKIYIRKTGSVIIGGIQNPEINTSFSILLNYNDTYLYLGSKQATNRLAPSDQWNSPIKSVKIYKYE